MAEMKGTGSNTLVAQDVFIPYYRIMSLPSLLRGDYPTPYKDEAPYRSSFGPVTALILIGPQLGLAARALELVTEKAHMRGISYTSYEKQAAARCFKARSPRRPMLIDTAHLHAYSAAADIDDAAWVGPEARLCRARAHPDGHGPHRRGRAGGHPHPVLGPWRLILRRVQSAPADLAGFRGCRSSCDGQSRRQCRAVRQLLCSASPKASAPSEDALG